MKLRNFCLFISLVLPIIGASDVNAAAQMERFYLSGPPSVAELKKFKASGGEVVIDLRDFDEKSKDCGEVITTTKLGLKYVTAPMPKANPLTAETVRRVDEAVLAAGDKPILLHCSTQQRAVAWLAVYLAKQNGLSVEAALDRTQLLGLTSEHMREAVRDYLASPHVP